MTMVVGGTNSSATYGMGRWNEMLWEVSVLGVNMTQDIFKADSATLYTDMPVGGLLTN
jgi:hypothetical protein